MSVSSHILAEYPPLLSYILDGKTFGPILKGPNVDRHREEWRRLMRELIACAPKDTAIANCFHTQWHVSHHYIRILIDDDELLMNMLWVWLPRYEGPDLLLYRGENIDRLERGVIGTAWSNRENTALMFVSGLNAIGKGGVIIDTTAPAEAIIAGPSVHSRRLNEHEYTVDRRRLGNISNQCYFPPSH